MHWFSNSQMKTEKEDQLLNLITCLEIIFTPESRDPIIQNIAEGVAILIGEDVNQKEDISERIRDLYDKRSSLSHHGKGTILDIDLCYLININIKILSLLMELRKNFNCKKDFHKWIEYRKFGGPQDIECWKAFRSPENVE